MNHLSEEIMFLCQFLLDVSSKYLPFKYGQRKKRCFIKDDELKMLCKNSKAAWKKWRNVGWRSHGHLLEEKKMTRKLFCNLLQQLEQSVKDYKYRNEITCLNSIIPSALPPNLICIYKPYSNHTKPLQLNY